MKNIIKVSLYTHTLKQCEFPTLKLVYCALTSKFDIGNALQWPRFMCTETVISCITFILKGKIYGCLMHVLSYMRFSGAIPNVPLQWLG